VKNEGFGFGAAHGYNGAMPAAATLSTRQRRLLADMGIDVWVRRAPAAVVEGVVAEPVVVESAVVTRTAAQPAITVSLDPTSHAAIELECIAAPGVVVIGAFAGAADRRFAQDVVLAVAGNAAVVRTQFRWPQTQTGDVSPAAARSAFAGFLRGQTQRADARCLLLLGGGATALLESAFSSDGCTVLSLPDAAQLRGDPAAKKSLWLAISPLVRG
jgi:DNA polymerase III psi subunit